MTEGLWIAGLLLFCAAGVVLALIRLPGTWLIVVSAALFSWHSDWSQPSWPILLVLVAMALGAEIIELLASLVTARKAGANPRAMWFAMIGGFVGMFLFTVPLPIIGTIIGGALGCFIGAVIGQLSGGHAVGPAFPVGPAFQPVKRQAGKPVPQPSDLKQSVRVGLFAAVGQVMGNVAKVMIAVTMAGTAVVAVLFSGR
ncbi:MAG: DUF456 domain-containing protein [Phycisphaerae bacterium]